MKIKIVFAWIFALLMLGPVVTASRSDDGNRTATGTYTIIKGQILDLGNNGSWDYLTFGVLSDHGSKACVNRIVITDLEGRKVAEIKDLYSFRDNGASWFFISLREFDLPFEFKTYIYIKTRDRGVVVQREALYSSTTRGPIDPDETVIVVRWP
ncbi:MAG: hypothetical protein A2X22_13725 [Bacteroidetes bacterium GWF2_49_14]|nr:MAG: hypothetical protein A2X22_13725 [Bacteroidetes bacterium GWF2_49_14]HBB93289.1 hypothetical protein [Bacteroidales bacterium]